ncbi:MAG: hypothetical protein HYZ40_18090 [Rhodospirillales bacterium]|nr:hypothetical protein [Rhodospirillales bacterium]
MKLAGLLVAMSCIGVVQGGATAQAQGSLKFTTIDCSASKIVAPPGLVCLVSNERAGGDFGAGTSEGLFKYWSAISRKDLTRKTYYYAVEALETKSTIRIGDRLVDEIQRVSAQAKGATDLSKLNQVAGADYVTFKAGTGESCVGFRRAGPSKLTGYAWVLYGTECAPHGQHLGEGDITKFISTSTFK